MNYLISDSSSCFCRVRNVLFFLALMVFSIADAGAQDRKVSVHLQNATLVQLLKTIEDQSDYRFIYNNSDINTDRRVTVDVENRAVESILSEYFPGFTPEVDGRNIVLKLSKVAPAKDITVKGRVVDENGEQIGRAHV